MKYLYYEVMSCVSAKEKKCVKRVLPQDVLKVKVPRTQG
nr:MAG TPA: hypothetical protein [Caudoviricetes sp.]